VKYLLRLILFLLDANIAASCSSTVKLTSEQDDSTFTIRKAYNTARQTRFAQADTARHK